MAEWDDENFEPRDLAGGALSNKWEGEDEDDEVKENWEDEDEEKKVEESAEAKAKPNKKKLLQEKAAEKERMKRDAYEKRIGKEVEEEISPEEQLRRQKESDLKAALDTTFSSEKLDDGTPSSKEEFQELANTITKNIQQFSKSDEYPTFTENIIRGVCTTLNVYDLRKIKTTIDNMVLEKQKLEKGDKPKKKGKGKAKLNVEADNYNQYSAFVDDFDDFGEYI